MEHCRRRFNARYGLAIDGVTPTAARALAAYTWPGNVRELEAILREAMILKGRGALEAENLALPIWEARGIRRDQMPPGRPPSGRPPGVSGRPSRSRRGGGASRDARSQPSPGSRATSRAGRWMISPGPGICGG